MPSPGFRRDLVFPASLVLSLFLSACTGGGHGGGGGGGANLSPPLFQVTITDSGSGTFTQGQQGATYTVTLKNIGQTAITSGGNVQVTATIPSGETLVSISGTGWTTPGGPVADRTDGLPAGQSWPPITVTVNVAANAASPQVFSVLASGGGSATIGGQDSTTITNAGLSITSLNPTSGPVGASITITGTNFGATKGTSTVTFNGTTATTITSWSATSITATVPTGATTGNVTVVVNGAVSNGVTFTITPGPSITSLTPNSGLIGASVVIAGANFGASQGSNTVTFNGVPVGTASAWTATSITVTVPTGATSGPVVVIIAGAASNGVTFTVTAVAAPTVSSLSLTSGRAGIPVTIAGANFGAAQGSNTVTFNGVSAGTASAWSATSITVAVPTGATTGNVVVTVGGVTSNGVAFTVTCSIPTLGNESLLNGTYTALFSGWADQPVSVTKATAAFQANGATALITSGEVDAGAVAIGVAQGAPVNTTFTGCFNLGADQRGLMIWNSALAQSLTFAFSVRANGSQGLFIEFDDANPSTAPGSRGAGFFEKQQPATSTNAPVAFSLGGYAPSGSNNDYRRSATVGVINTITFGGAAVNGTADIAFTNDGTGSQLNVDDQAFTATFSSYDSLGRGTATIAFADLAGLCGTPPCPITLNFAYYLSGIFNSPGRVFLQSTDIPDNAGHSLVNGQAIPQAPGITFNSGSLGPNAIVHMTGADLTPNHAYTDVAVGRIHSSGAGDTTVNLDEVSNGGQVNVGTTAITGGAFTVSANGMGSISFGTTRFFSVAMISDNTGFILEGTQANTPIPGHILVGEFQPQMPYGPTGQLGSGVFSGLYAIGDDHPASTNSNNFVGSINANPGASPPNFSGTTRTSDGATCLTNCLSKQTVAATYSGDTIGRITVTYTSGASGMPVGWALTTTEFDFLSDTTAGTMNGTILKAIQ
jgi:IPT/TIG domain